MIRSMLALLGLSVFLLAMVGRGLQSTETVTTVSEWPDAVELDSLRRYLEPVQATSQLADQAMFVPAQPTLESFEVPAPAAAGSTPGPRTARWVLNAVLVTEGSRHAIVNDVPVSIGALLPDGARVTAIEADRVTLSDRGRVHLLRLGEGEE